MQDALEINDYMEPADQLDPDADAEDGRHGNDDANHPQYAEVMATRRSEPRRGTTPLRLRPYANDGGAQYAVIDHNLLQQTVVLVVD